ncbi:hypothetical protein ZOSMA_112G00520 [Zostera marina]|uniref:Protein FAM204A n=1 Tax=Zostera marina TaxID=29655 RepID=A0A0K9Q2V2_ZOSMR|nr:hypothetical protein ZOSMA_112G00520 [Zostera marina]
MGAEEEGRREAALAATSLLDPNFKSSRITKAQLDKFKELNQKRLQLIEKGKKKKRNKGSANRNTKDKNVHNEKNDSQSPNLEDFKCSLSNTDFTKPPPVESLPTKNPMKRQKLHWGLDAKERWERKANM